MWIRIISGSYGLHDGRRVLTMTARSGPFEVEDAEGAALIAAGVAAGSSEFGIRNSELEPCESSVVSRQSSVVRESARALTGNGGAVGGAAAAAAVIVTPAACGDKSGERRAESGELRESGERNAESGDDSAILIPDAGLDSTVDYLTLSAAELRGLCEERGIGYKKNASTKALRAALEQYDEVCAACEVPPDVFDAGQRLLDAESDEDGIMPELLAADQVEAERIQN